MASKTVLIVEDSEAQRLALEQALVARGFRAVSATSFEHARSLDIELGTTLDVAVLDMRLEDWADAEEERNVGLTGADLGIEMRDARKKDPPEFLVLSAYPAVPYFRQAIKLGVAAYLEKPIDQSEVIRHVRALVLRRALGVNRPRIARCIDRLEVTGESRSQAVLRFCREVLCRELADVLGAPFVLLVTTHGVTHCLTVPNEPPEDPNETYEVLQEAIHGRVGHASPFYLDIATLTQDASSYDATALSRFDKGVFVPLTHDSTMRLSIGLLPSSEEHPLAEEPKPLARVLAAYLRPAVLEHLLRISAKCAELAGERKAVLSATSKVCLFVGQEETVLLAEAIEADEQLARHPAVQELTALAEDLRDIGGLLSELGREEAEDQPIPTRFSLAEVTRRSWEELCAATGIDVSGLDVEGDCHVEGVEDDVFFAISKLLQWLGHRGAELPSERGPVIRATCSTERDRAEIVIEDQSPRLPGPLRKQLFLPFAQVPPRLEKKPEGKRPGEHLPLYLSRVLVELRNRGRIEDRSSEIPGERGHRFAISFAPATTISPVGD